MKILVIGNLGYVGPVVVQHLSKINNAVIVGLDTGYFANCITTKGKYCEYGISEQIYLDARSVNEKNLAGFDAIVYLAAISNDPMGNEFENPTFEINQNSAIRIANCAKKVGVKNFVFASSCSVYGSAEGKRNEESELNPLTTYAKSKIRTELDLRKVADDSFKVTCLRFATACGFSPRLRLDLVLNDFVASAFVNKKIDILSDGTPWRPLIHVKDMALAIEWGIYRTNDTCFIAINAGSDMWNYQVKQLADAVARAIPGTIVNVNPNAQPDKRSYQVDFSLFRHLAPDHQPKIDLVKTIDDLISGLNMIKFSEPKFRDSDHYIRLNTLRSHIESNQLDKELCWV